MNNNKGRVRVALVFARAELSVPDKVISAYTHYAGPSASNVAIES
jgi:hypothetical protein